MKRLFLILLVFFNLIVATTVQHTINAPIITPDKVLGSIHVHELVFALPSAIYAAGLLIVACGIGAEFWRAVLPLCGAGWIPQEHLRRIANAGLWCGWLTLGCCAMALNYIFPQLFPSPQPTFSNVDYTLMLGGGFIAMLAVKLLNTYLPKQGALIAALLCAAVALMLGQFWWNGLPIDFLAMAILLPTSLHLCIPDKELPLEAPICRLQITALALAIYATAFSQLIISYPTAPVEYSTGWLSVKFCTNTLLVIAIIAMLTPKLRNFYATRAITGALSLIAVAIYSWEALCGPLDAALCGMLPLAPSVCIYAVALLCLSGLCILHAKAYAKAI